MVTKVTAPSPHTWEIYYHNASDNRSKHPLGQLPRRGQGEGLSENWHQWPASQRAQQSKQQESNSQHNQSLVSENVPFKMALLLLEAAQTQDSGSLGSFNFLLVTISSHTCRVGVCMCESVCVHVWVCAHAYHSLLEILIFAKFLSNSHHHFHFPDYTNRNSERSMCGQNPRAKLGFEPLKNKAS